MIESLVDKYAPKNLDELFLAHDTRKALTRYVEHGLSDHLVFWGLTGTGKTTAAHIIANAQDNVDIYYKKFGLSTQHDNKIFKEVIKRVKSITLFGEKRIFILDELDNLSAAGFKPFNTLLEDYNDKSRFILITNNSEQITDKIASRSRVLQFQHATYDSKKDQLVYYPHFPKNDFHKELRKLFDRIAEGEGIREDEKEKLYKAATADPINLKDTRNFIRSLGTHIIDIKDERSST